MEPITVSIMGSEFTFDPERIEIREEPPEAAGMIAATVYADRHGVSAATVRRWLNDGRIEGDRFMGRWYVNGDAEPPEPTAYGRPRGSRIIRTRQAKKGPFFESS